MDGVLQLPYPKPFRKEQVLIILILIALSALFASVALKNSLLVAGMRDSGLSEYQMGYRKLTSYIALSLAFFIDVTLAAKVSKGTGWVGSWPISRKVVFLGILFGVSVATYTIGIILGVFASAWPIDVLLRLFEGVTERLTRLFVS